MMTNKLDGLATLVVDPADNNSTTATDTHILIDIGDNMSTS